MKSIYLSDLTPNQRYHYMLGTVTPRPIALVSTMDNDGRPNLAPYSFFNVFSGTPPILIFSANTRSHISAEKDTLVNIRNNGEAVINLVSHSIVHQMALSGLDYPAGVDEFGKSGLTPIASLSVKPYRVKESPVHFECRLLEIKSMGKAAGSANLIIMQAQLMHISENAILPNNRIDSSALDIVGRLGASQYTHVAGASIFDVPLPSKGLPVGFEAIPSYLRQSEWLSARDLAQLAGSPELSRENEVAIFRNQPYFRSFSAGLRNLHSDEQSKTLHLEIKRLIGIGEVSNAWNLILACVQEPSLL